MILLRCFPQIFIFLPNTTLTSPHADPGHETLLSVLIRFTSSYLVQTFFIWKQKWAPLVFKLLTIVPSSIFQDSSRILYVQPQDFRSQMTRHSLRRPSSNCSTHHDLELMRCRRNVMVSQTSLVGTLHLNLST